MPLLANPRHERFAQCLAMGSAADEAYVTAGYKAVRGHASRLAAKGNIRARVAELASRAAAGVVITRQRVIEEMALLAFAEIGHPNVTASVKRAALRDLAMMFGWLIERREIGGAGDFDRMTEKELDRYIAERAEPWTKPH